MVPDKRHLLEENAFAISPPMNVNSAHVAPAPKNIHMLDVPSPQKKTPSQLETRGSSVVASFSASHQAAGVSGDGGAARFAYVG